MALDFTNLNVAFRLGCLGLDNGLRHDLMKARLWIC
jgi:hypothetical protein